MADEELELDVTQPKSNKMTTILLIVLIVLVLIMGGVGAWLFLGKDSNDSDSDGKSTDAKDQTEKVLEPLHYLSLVPEFVVNFGPGSKVRYLQIDLQVSTREEKSLNTINTYRPVLRNDILVLLSGLSFEELRYRAGKEALQVKLLNTINNIVTDAMHGEKKKEGHGSKDDVAVNEKQKTEHAEGPIENVYFTSFIMQ